MIVGTAEDNSVHVASSREKFVCVCVLFLALQGESVGGKYVPSHTECEIILQMVHRDL